MFIQKNRFNEFLNQLSKTTEKYGNRFIEEKKQTMKTNIKEIIKGERDLSLAFEEVNVSRRVFESEAKDVEEKLLLFEKQKDQMIPNDANSQEDYLNKKLEFVREKEKEYEKSVEKYNSVREKYINISNNQLVNVKKINNELTDSFQFLLLSFCALYISKIVNERDDLNEHNKTIVQIPFKEMNEKDEFFEPIIPEEKQFIPYQIKLLENKQIITMPILKMVEKMKRVLTSIGENLDFEKEVIKLKVRNIIGDLVQNNNPTLLTEKDEEVLRNYIKDKEYRIQLLGYLNFIRSQGKFQICKRSFVELGKIMQFIVKCISEEKDFESLRYCLIMCQTYYFINRKGEKFYLVKYIENIKLFQENDFWEFYFCDSLCQEIEKLNQSNQDKYDQGRNVANIAFSKILSIAHNMMEFQVDKEKIKKLIHTFCTQYDVNDDLENQIYSMIDEIIYDNKTFDPEVDLTEKETIQTDQSS